MVRQERWAVYVEGSTEPVVYATTKKLAESHAQEFRDSGVRAGVDRVPPKANT